MKVAGVDFSSLAIDVVLVELDDLEPPVWYRYPLAAGGDAFERTRKVRDSMPFDSFWDDVLAIGIEHPAGRFGVGAMMRVQGAVLACLPSGVLVQPWPPARWRTAVGLAGNASKDDVRASVPTLAWNAHWIQDAFDAYCIALATRAAISVKDAA